ncbi:MAG TPA: helix-turn-helix transcriptional regulator [Armatimonadota bacterium]|nr:helix-turn-helix transcriptional regulator [Armatimonadota bacterium]HOS44186.1 helix-turn-helix transcriptional regulator [Armatimonadota bacterium]
MAAHENFIDWLQREMQSRGWNQAELARRSGTTTAQISRVMTGEQRPGPTVSRKLARALHIPPEEVFRRAGLLPATQRQPEGTEELVYHFSCLDEEDRKRLLIIARSLHEAKDEE